MSRSIERFSMIAMVFVNAVMAAVQPPNDPLFSEQVSLFGGREKIEQLLSSRSPRRQEFDANASIHLNILPAWKVTTGSPDVVVAVIDDGFFYEHEDLRANIWQNPGESGVDDNGIPRAINGRDDDSNGYVDDLVGWDFAFNDPDPDGYVFDGMDASRIAPYSHGNPSLGIIGAEGNNGVGVCGINWRVSLMPLKIGAQGTPRGFIDARRINRAAMAIRYAVDNGARIISWSQFISDYRPNRLAVLREAITYAEQAGVLIVVGAGNDGLDRDEPENALYPASFPNDNILVVAEIDFLGRLDSTKSGKWRNASAFGQRTVDIAAIGRNLSTNVYHHQSVYSLGGGTSHATPVVAGVAALMLSVNPDLNATDLKRILMQTSTPLESLQGKVACGGMVNAGAAVLRAQSLAH